ncbi:MAG: recombinase family protein [Caldisericia bacterium]|nr:recombinase family protein [Caldisericia bacterium]
MEQQTTIAPAGTNNLPLAQIPVKYCLYARKSTESDEKQALSIESQTKEMLRLAERDSLEIIDVRRESHSAKDSGERPVFNEIIVDLKRGRFNGILTWAPDRLSRNAGDLGTLVDLMDQKVLLEIRTYGQRFINSPNEKFLLMILCSQAKLENDNKSLNVKRGLRMRVEMGLWPGAAPTGYLNEKRIDRKGQILIDPERASVIKQMFERVANEKWSGRKLYHWLKFDLNFKTKSNHHLSLSNIYLILQNSFYYGVFEYPQGSGSWYTGKHKPIIKKDLFDKVQEQLKRDQIQRENRDFAFTKLITCGLCGSGITAEEKFKKQKNGNVHRYVYYGCTRSRDLHCKGGYIREEELINQLIVIIDKLDVNELGVRDKFERELERYNKFRRIVLGLEKDEELPEEKIDSKTYAKYLLKEGSIVEKRELLGCLKTKLVLKDKIIQLEK